MKGLLVGYLPPTSDIVSDDDEDDYTEYFGTFYVKNLSTNELHSFTYSVNHSDCPSGYTSATYESVDEERVYELPTHDVNFKRPLVEYIQDMNSYHHKNAVVDVKESSCGYYPDGNTEVNLTIFGM